MKWIVEIGGQTRRYEVEAPTEDAAVEKAWDLDAEHEDEVQLVWRVGGESVLPEGTPLNDAGDVVVDEGDRVFETQEERAEAEPPKHEIIDLMEALKEAMKKEKD